MFPNGLLRGGIVCLVFLRILGSLNAGDDLRIQASHSGDRVTVGVPNGTPLTSPTEFRLQYTQDLTEWINVGPKVRLPAGMPPPESLTGDGGGETGFYRLSYRNATFSAQEGGEVLGYDSLLADQLDAIGDIRPEEFATHFPQPIDYLPGLTWEVTTAQYWSDFQNPNPVGRKPGWPGPVLVSLPSLALTPAELERIRTLGFVATDRFRAPSFADVYYDIFRRDLPVLMTTDSILHAWHRSYDGILEDLELKALQPQLRGILGDMAAQVPAAHAAYGTGALAASVRDADYFLTVARRLLDPEVSAPSVLEQEGRVSETLSAIASQQPRPFTFFDLPPGQPQELVDFSQFIPRGHYTKQFNFQLYFPGPMDPLETLTNYFRAVMWLGRVDLRVAGNTNHATPRQLGTALVLQDLLQRSGAFDRWQQLDQTLNVMVGPADSMNFEQLGGLLTAAGIAGPDSITSLEQLSDLQAQIEAGTLGSQSITGHGYWGSAGNDQVKLPRSFAFLGQRFTMDNWVLNNVTFDRLVKAESEPPELIRRRRPYSLDVAFTVFGNNQVVPELLANMANTSGQPWRDGFPYQHALTALRLSLDQVPAATWENNLYNRWLLALRSLSQPTTGPEFPEAMRTRAWAMKTVNTQLASWTQLRHDTVLYSKASEAPPVVCFYPYAFVEPQPDFYRRMRELALLAEDQIGGLTAATAITNRTHPFLRRFADTCATLEGIAAKELRQETLASSETNFLANLIEEVATYAGDRQYNGWYPQLYYRGSEGLLGPLPWMTRLPDHDSSQPDFLVADVFTDGPSEPDGDPGGVLHEGTGMVNYLFIGVDNGPDRILYAGPTLSHFEFWEPYGTRLTDKLWESRVTQRKTPPSPPWVLSYTAPSP